MTENPEPAQATIADKKRIMVVEDEPLLALALRRALQARLGVHYDVDISPLAGEALDKLAGEPAHLMITDLRMPGMNGLELIRRMRQTSPRMRTMLITAFGSLSIEEEAAELQATYLSKPFSLQQFVAAVRVILDEIDAEELQGRAMAPQERPA